MQGLPLIGINEEGYQIKSSVEFDLYSLSKSERTE